MILSLLIAAIAGAVFIPIFILGWDYIRENMMGNRLIGNLLVVAWGIPTFWLPVYLACRPRKAEKHDEILKQFGPAWCRIILYGLTGAAVTAAFEIDL